MAIIKIKNAAIDLDAAEIPNLPATKITSGTFDNARISLDAAEIPNLDTAKITTGTLADARVPDLNASKITAGTIATARLGSGTANSSTFLRGDNTFAEAGGGSLVLISNTTISSTGTLDINNIFSSTYQNYRVIGSNLKCANDNNAFVLQFKTSSAAVTSQYFWSGVGMRANGSAVDDGQNPGSDWRIIGNASNDAASVHFDMTLFQPNVANVSKNYICIAGGRRSDDTAQVLTCSGFLPNNTAMVGLRFMVGSGNITAGNILVFGIKDS